MLKQLFNTVLALPLLASAASATPEQAVATLWRALSHGPNQSGNAPALRDILHPDAMVYGVRYRDGAAPLQLIRGADFAASQEKVRPHAFYECEVARDVRQYDRFATVYSVVESRADRAAPQADFTGVNSIQLYRSEQGWQIVSLYYHVEKPGLPILSGGKPGACLD